MSVPQINVSKKIKQKSLKKEGNIVSAIPPSILIATGTRRKPLSASGFLLVDRADKHKLHESICIKEAQ